MPHRPLPIMLPRMADPPPGVMPVLAYEPRPPVVTGYRWPCILASWFLWLLGVAAGLTGVFLILFSTFVACHDLPQTAPQWLVVAGFFAMGLGCLGLMWIIHRQLPRMPRRIGPVSYTHLTLPTKA